LDPSTDIEQITLTDVIKEQAWCISLEKTKITNKVLITTTKAQLEKACKGIDNTLPDIYISNIDDKIDATTLQHITTLRLDKPTLTAASTAYADKLKHHTMAIDSKLIKMKCCSKPPRQRKTPTVGMIFDKTAFPLTTETMTTTSATTTTQTTAPIATTSAMVPSEPYDYQAKLDRILEEIETTLKKQFKDMFSQMDKKIEQLAQQHT